MFEKFDKVMCDIFKDAENEMINLYHPYVGTEHLFLSLLKNDEEIKDYFQKIKITYTSFKDYLIKVVGRAKKKSSYILYTPLLKQVIECAIDKAETINKSVLKPKMLLWALLECDDGIAIQLLKKMGVNLKKVIEDMDVSREVNVLGEVGVLLNETIGDSDRIYERDKEIEKIINILLKKEKCNPLLIGKPGVGKTAIVKELVRRIKENEVPRKLINKKVYALNLGSLISGTKYRGDFEERLTNILKEVEKNELILFIDEIHGIMNCGGAEGAVCASEILKPYLTSGKIKIIGATTEREYAKYMVKDKAILRRFDLVRINEANMDVTAKILEGIKKEYEDFHNLKITKKNIKDIVNLSSRYIKDRANPDRAIELLDLVCARVNQVSEENYLVKDLEKAKIEAITNNNYIEAQELSKKIARSRKKKIKINYEDILGVLEDKYEMKLLENSNDLIVEIKNNLKQIVGQEKVKEELMKLINYKLKQGVGVMSALLLGNTGVGKTETVKLIAKSLGNHNFIRLDMSEYNLETSINKLIGVSSGYVGYNDVYEFEKVKINPFTVILVDEVEKANPKVLNLFLQILDNGIITDGMGDIIDFRNTLIFFTSNLGVKNSIGFMDKKMNDIEEFFTPELLGRFDKILKYDDIKKEDVVSYVDNYQIKNKVRLNLEEILRRCNYEKYGLRNVEKVIREIEMEKLACV